MILGLVEVLTRDYIRRIIDRSEAIIHICRAEREVGSEPGVCVVDGGRNNPKKDCKAEEDVGSGPVRAQKRVSIVRDHGPVKS